VNQYQYSIREDGDGAVVDLTGYPFKDWYHFAAQFNWVLHHYGSPTYSHGRLKVFGDNIAYITILDGKDIKHDDPIYRFGFRQMPDAMNFYLSFV
jgi:hypothetical protein